MYRCLYIWGSGRLLDPLLAEQLVDVALDLGEVAELAVDRGEADICDVVEFAQLFHHQFADLTRRDLHLAGRPQLRLDLVDGCLDRRGRDVALLTSGHQPVEELLAVEVLAAAVLLDDVEGDVLDPLVRRETLVALQAFAPPPDRLTGVRIARVDNLELLVTTIWSPQGSIAPGAKDNMLCSGRIVALNIRS